MTGTGIAEPTFARFYAEMLPALARQNMLRTVFARHKGRDIGFSVGAEHRGHYRGLQMSFDQSYRDKSLGNLCQLRQIEALCATEAIDYDLGTNLDYKMRWAEGELSTSNVVCVRTIGRPRRF